MSETPEETTTGIPDEDLPEDLVPGDDNPLAEGLDDGETVDDLMTGGKQAEQSSESDADSDSGSDSGSEESQDG